MLNFFRKKSSRIVRNNLDLLKADMHSHLVPGIDDGAPDVETSLQLIQGLIRLGYRKIITTPHVMQDLYRNDRNTILENYHIVRYELKKRQIDIDFQVAAEYFLDDHFDTLLEMDNELLTIHDNWILVEFSFVNLPIDYKQKIFAMQIRNYQPVLAHPERYLYLHRNKILYHELKEAGCLLQVNMLSLVGYYGKSVMDAAHYLVRNQLVDLVGTDMHHERHLQQLENPDLYPIIQQLLDSGKLKNSQL